MIQAELHRNRGAPQRGFREHRGDGHALDKNDRAVPMMGRLRIHCLTDQSNGDGLGVFR